MANRCDKHHSVVAMMPEWPGAYASCVDEPRFLADFAVRELHAGATLRRVTCNEAHRMLKVYMKWCDEQAGLKKQSRRRASTRCPTR